MRSWYRLDIDITSALNKNFRFPLIHNAVPPAATWDGPATGSYILRPRPEELLNTEWLETVKSKFNYTLNDVVAFYTPASARYPYAHVDVDLENDSCAIYGLNFLPFYDTRDMVWYDNEKLKDRKIRQQSPAGTYYDNYPIVDEFLIDRCRIGKQLTLVRTDIPHRIDDAGHGQAPRLAISLRPGIPAIKTWEDAVEYFRPFIIPD